MKQIITSIFILLVSGSSFSQNEELKKYFNEKETVIDTLPRIQMIGQYVDGKMQLRWAPNTTDGWIDGLLNGYLVEKFQMDKDENPILNSRDTFVVKVWEENAFKPYYSEKAEDKYIGIMGSMVYGKVPSGVEGGIFQQGEDLKNKYSFALFSADMDYQAAIAGGLAFEDTEAIPGSQYFYRISLIKTNQDVFPAYSTEEATIRTIPVPFVAVVIEGEGKVTLQWDRFTHVDHFSGYYIERSDDGQNFTSLTDSPFVGGTTDEFPSSIFSYTDNVENYQPHYYRLVGITPFGERSIPSETFQARGRDRTPCPEAQNIKLVTDEPSRLVKLSWDKTSCEDLLGYYIVKGNAPNQKFKEVSPLIKPTDPTEFEEILSSTRNKVYYKVITIDTAGNASETLARLAAFRDTMPPAIPTGLSGTIDSNGVVVVTWKPNTEEDLRGYHVYRANADYHMFTMINPVPFGQATFRDTITLKTMTEEIFYKVTSVDYQGHLSDFSEPLRIVKPDTIRPFPPSITYYNQELDHIYIDWTPSRSKDVVKHELHKKTNDGQWLLVNNWNPSSSRIKDMEVQPGNLYQYRIRSIDDADLISVDHAKISVNFIDKTNPDEIQIISCVYIDSSNVEITWEIPNDNEIKHITIFRSINDGPMTVIGREPKKSSFTDTMIKPNTSYSYTLKKVWLNGRKSKFGNIETPVKKQ